MQEIDSREGPLPAPSLVRRFGTVLPEPALQIDTLAPRNSSVLPDTAHESPNHIPRGIVAESYARLNEAVRRTKYIKAKDIRKSDLSDVLGRLHRREERVDRRDRADRRRVSTSDVAGALEVCSVTMDRLALDDDPSRSLLWAALGHVMDALRNRSALYAEFLEFLIYVGRVFERVVVHVPSATPNAIKHLAGVQQCFIDSVTILVTFVESKAIKLVINASFAQGISKQLDQKKDEMDRHEYLVAREGMMQLRDDLRRVGGGSEARTTAIREEMQSQILEFLQEHGRDLRDYTQYITAPPLIGMLDLHQGFLVEDASHVKINILDEPKVSQWMESETSSLLCLEGFSTGEFLNWTSEFALDVVHAAQERGYVVLHHFCDLLDPIRAKLLEDARGAMATSTILRCFLCLIRSQYMAHIDSSYSAEITDLNDAALAALSGKALKDRFRSFIESFKPGIILYVVIDSVQLLDEYANGNTDRIKKWLMSITKLVEYDKIIVKVLFTSIKSTTSSIDFFEHWENNANSSSSPAADKQLTRDDTFPHQVLRIVDDKKSGTNQASARRQGTPSKPIIPKQPSSVE